MSDYSIITKYSYDLSTPTLLVIFILFVLLIVSMWMIFEKAGEAGWKSLIPFYSSYKLFQIATDHGWMFLLVYVPIIGWIFQVYMVYKLAGAFGKGIGFTVGMVFLPIVFYPILAFGSSEYCQFDDYDY